MPNRVAPRLNIEYLRSIDWWSKVIKTDDESDCWLWSQSKGSHGYGQTWDGVTVRLAHRVAWVLTHGPIPDDLTVDHICRNRTCCNPAHLRLLTNLVNATDNGQGRKTHCPSGHEYAGENLYVDPHGHRRCRTCAKERRMRAQLA